MNSFLKIFLAALMFGGLCPLAGAQHPPVTVIEGAVETTADAVSFPDSVNGSLEVRGCKTCPSPLMKMDAKTVFSLGGARVTLQEMAAYARTAQGKSMTIHYWLKNRIVSSIEVLEK